MSVVKEFREFAFKGNMVDLAVGVVIGGAFGKIVNSLVENIITPPLGVLTKTFGVNFKDWSLKDSEGKIEYLKQGAFIQSIVDFLIIAVAIFVVVKLMNTAKKRFETEKAAAPPAAPSEDILLLREIRDELRNR